MCIELPAVTLPTLGGGLSLAPPTLASFSGDLGLCCKSVPYATPPIPLPLPFGIMSGAIGLALSAAATTINVYIDSLVPDCPLE